MIQRIQTVYLALAFILTAVCLCLQVGTFHPTGMGADTYMFNLWCVQPDGSLSFGVWPLFALLLLTCPLALVAIFSYKNRPLQMRCCVVCMLLILAWVVAYILYGYVFKEADSTFSPAFAACLPVVSLIFYVLARRGVKHDEKLIRDLDSGRIR